MSADPSRRLSPAGDRGRPGPVVRKDADGLRSIGPTWESVTERIIREAQERGEFDDLPGRGRPFVVDENPYAGEMALAFHLLKNAGVAPPWIETDKEVRRLRAAAETLLRRGHAAPLAIRATLRRQLDEAVTAHDDMVRRLNVEAPSVRSHRRPIGRDVALAALDAAFRGEPAVIPGADGDGSGTTDPAAGDPPGRR
jgi:hypothetical protein